MLKFHPGEQNFLVKDRWHIEWKKGSGGGRHQAEAEVRVARRMTSENLFFQRNF